jgi:hypothetical protein
MEKPKLPPEEVIPRFALLTDGTTGKKSRPVYQAGKCTPAAEGSSS